MRYTSSPNLARIYGREDSGQIIIGRLASAEGIPVRLDLDKLVTRHSAVLKSTGAGKSTTVASLLRSIAYSPQGAPSEFPSSRILLLDIHGEYGRALGSMSAVFRVTPSDGENPLHIPYWVLDPSDLLAFLMGHLDDRPLTQILDRVFEYKLTRATANAIPGVDLSLMTVDSPIPYSLKKLWFILIDREVKTWLDQHRTQPAIVTAGDANTLTLLNTNRRQPSTLRP